jgi:hypothetical protein
MRTNVNIDVQNKLLMGVKFQVARGRERTIFYVVEKHMEVIMLIGWMKPRIQVKYHIF